MIQAITSLQPFQTASSAAQLQQSQGTGFSEMLKQSINQVNEMQVKSDGMTAALAEGKNVQLQDVMITAEKASVAMLTAIEIRNKAVEAYQEAMRMQI
ncbi:flagellar hook-basal body complex protein FliE [Metabacillus indicus]|uniref:flagellar hook-basal body complex protein FliE n=1 Tax=Metabacillus indicus TaxID=246786 RepID=UPI00317BF6AA